MTENMTPQERRIVRPIVKSRLSYHKERYEKSKKRAGSYIDVIEDNYDVTFKDRCLADQYLLFLVRKQIDEIGQDIGVIEAIAGKRQ